MTTTTSGDCLNVGFLQSAFNDQGSEKIASINVDGNSTMNDKIFLLSKDEVENSLYGFANDTSRKRKITDYSKVVGVTYSDRNGQDKPGNGIWWLRTPNTQNIDRALVVGVDGDIREDFDVNESYFGVVPALCLNNE